MLNGPERTIRRSRALRREMSLPELLLWQALRARPAGLKFRRQHPSGPFTADFFCHEARLVVEIDGAAHGMGDAPERDARRDDWFALRQFTVLRIPATAVLKDLDGVVRGIVHQARRSTPLRQASPDASPFREGL